VLTENNNERFEKTLATIRECGAKYYSVQEEKAPETGHLHLQGYVGFTNPRAFTSMQKLFPGCHLEMAKDPSKAYDYCSKEDSWTGRVRIKSADCPPTAEENKGGLKQEVWKKFLTFAEQHTWDECIDAFPSLWAREEPGMRKHYERLHILKKVVPKKEVFVFWGPPGTGKSTSVKAQLNTEYFQLMDGKWWDGYNYEDTVFIDDFQPGQMSRASLLRLMDPGAARMEVKGGTCNVIAHKIYITSNWSPDEWYPEKDKDNQYDRAVAIWRRAHCYHFEADGVTHDTHGRGNTRAPAVETVMKNQLTLFAMVKKREKDDEDTEPYENSQPSQEEIKHRLKRQNAFIEGPNWNA